MDPVSLTLGILPLAGGAIKAYGTARKKLKVYRHYSREVTRLRKRLDRQQDFFYGEIQLLIRACLVDEVTAARMLDDPADPEWQSMRLDEELRAFLKRSYGSCREIVEDIHSTISDLQSELQCFEKLSLQRQEGESIKDTAYRLRNKVKFVWNKQKFEDCIRDLRDSNSDLRWLREQSNEIRDDKSRVSVATQCRKQLPQEYGDFKTIGRASKALHRALASAWSTSESDTSNGVLRHSVKLFVDAKVRGEVQMDLAVLCYGHNAKGSHLIQPTLQRLQVRSQVLDWMEPSLMTPPPSDDGRQKWRKVRFTDDSSTIESLIVNSPRTTPLTHESPGSRSTSSDNLSGRDICSILKMGKSRLSCVGTRSCLGYMESCSEQTFRHSFYQEELKSREVPRCGLELKSLISMDQVLEEPAETSVSIVDQLKFARNMVAAVLKFYSTPWLNQYFAISDISFFRSGADFAQSLETLHFGIDFIEKDCSTCTGSTMQGVEETSPDATAAMLAAFENAKLQYGIRNITLWSLGAILLQIGRWSTVGSPDDVLKIRKVSSQASVLGPRYQELTKRCLECDFGYGEDLGKPRLQQAVYENVFCELSDMINSLDLNDLETQQHRHSVPW